MSKKYRYTKCTKTAVYATVEKNLYAVPYFPKYRNLKTGGGGAVGTFSKKV